MFLWFHTGVEAQLRLSLKKGAVGNHDSRLQVPRHHFVICGYEHGVEGGDREVIQEASPPECQKLQKEVEETVPKGQQTHIIVDNYSTHKHKNVLEWVEKKKRISLHFMPVNSSWLNMVERFFSTLTEKQIHRRVYTSVKYLEECLRNYVDTYNKKP